MGSLLDLDLFTSPNVTNIAADVIIPKQEPLDDVTLNPNLTKTNPASFSARPCVEHNGRAKNDVVLDFYRVSEMFRTAFPDNFDPNAQAVVPVPESRNNAVAESSKKKNQPRGNELVRVTNLGIEDERCFREVVRKTRMLYDSFRVFKAYEDEKCKNQPGFVRTGWSRADLDAGSAMKDSGLWLNRDKRVVGAIPGVNIGDVFLYRMEMCVVGLQGLPQGGIDYLTANQSANGEPIATCIIASGGYEDDDDGGDVIIYTGQGGQDKHGRQVDHQKLELGNLGLERSMHYGVEVRVVRGFKYEGSPTGKVYVYDGLYKVVEAWLEVGKSGFGVIKFKLVRMESQPVMGSVVLKFAESFRNWRSQVMPMGYASMDMSMKKEKVPVFLFNDIDDNHDPMCYDYLVTSIFPHFVYHLGGNGGGCNCVSGCMDDCFCARKNGGEFAYDHNGLLIRGKPLIFECGPHCSCPSTCKNRVSQNGVKNRLEVFRSRETGWGVRSLDLIQAGSFIFEYTGAILTREQAQLFAMTGDNLIYPNRFAERWAEWGDLSQIISDYVRPSYPSVPPLDFAMDVSKMRNVACYMSHSVCPNVFAQLVLYDHSNLAFPHLMLFAMENIPPMRELSLDYGEAVADESTGKLLICN